jgi:hypothetical protein
VVAGVAHALFDDYHHNVESTYLSLFDSSPGSTQCGTRSTTRGARSGSPNYFRKPYGPDGARRRRGYHKDPLTVLGITDASTTSSSRRRADQSFTGARPTTTPCTTTSNSVTKRPPDVRAHVSARCDGASAPGDAAPPGAVHGNQEAMDDFVSVLAGTLSPPSSSTPTTSAASWAAG